MNDDDNMNDNHRNPNVPRYCNVNRTECPLLQACWDQEWDRVRQILETDVAAASSSSYMRTVTQPQRHNRNRRSFPHHHHQQQRHVFCRTLQGDRTALHLSTMPGAGAPVTVLEALLRANPHALLVSDAHKHGGTPMHFLCGSLHRNNPSIVRLFVETAIQVEHKYFGNHKHNNNQKKNDDSKEEEEEQQQNSDNTVLLSRQRCLHDDFWSPLLVACRKASPPETLQILVDSRQHTSWIAPWTGSETQTIGSVHPCCRIKSETATNVMYHSPLLILWQNTFEQFPDERLSAATLQQMRQVTSFMLQHDDDKSSSWAGASSSSSPTKHLPDVSMYSTDRGGVHPAVEAWVKIMVLLRPNVRRNGCMTHTVASLYYPIPPLLQLVCQLFPQELLHNMKPSQSIMGGNEDKNAYPLIPLHAALRYQGRWRFEWAKSIAVLQAVCPESLTVVDMETGLYPALLAAGQDAMLETIFAMIKACPQVLQFQRQYQKQSQQENNEWTLV